MARTLLPPVSVSAEVVLTVYRDAVKAEVVEYGRSQVVGWFRDEVSSIAAVTETLIMRSAILPELRKVPELVVRSNYATGASGQPVKRFIRGTAVKMAPTGRRIVLLPGASSKSWLSV